MTRSIDGESFQHKDTRVPSEPRYELRKRTHSQQQQNSMLLLIHKFGKLSIHEMNEEDISKTLKESVDLKGLSFLTSGDREVVNFTRSRVKTKSKLTNLMKIS